MISGRGLGHTGGTLDKLEAIPGVITDVAAAKLRQILRKTGCAIVGAIGRHRPADQRLYAIRDVTGTVESVDLITASILSKKLAAGLQGLVLDVKVGSGAFMKTEGEATALARALVDVANGAGCPTAALITDMDEPLAPALGQCAGGGDLHGGVDGQQGRGTALARSDRGAGRTPAGAARRGRGAAQEEADRGAVLWSRADAFLRR